MVNKNRRLVFVCLIILVALAVFFLKLYAVNYAWPLTNNPLECVEIGNFTGFRCGFIFDEAIYVPSAREMLYFGKPMNNEHPPLAKWFIMAGIMIMGDNPYGWRFFNCLFSSASIILAGYLFLFFKNSYKTVFLTLLLLAFDLTSFNMGMMAILDPATLFFSLLGTVLLLKRKLILSGLAFGLSVLSKLTGVLVLIGVASYLLIAMLYANSDKKRAIKEWIISTVIVASLSIVVFLVGLTFYDYAYHAFINPIEHIRYMLTHYERFGAPFWWMHGGQNQPPIAWVTPFIPSNPWDVYSTPIRIVTFYLIRTPLWISSWLVFALCIVDLVSMHKKGGLAYMELFFITWFASNYLVWYPIGWFVRKHIFPYYFYMTAPAVALGCNVLDKDTTRKVLLYLLIASQLFFFFAYFPVKNMDILNLLWNIGIPF